MYTNFTQLRNFVDLLFETSILEYINCLFVSKKIHSNECSTSIFYDASLPPPPSNLRSRDHNINKMMHLLFPY